ncbi:MAG TPA: tetratricopeptide repeat protein [Anaerolineales bacterium]|nr:tetratricopeptide repeat protein [Anaerolineales bacterium]
MLSALKVYVLGAPRLELDGAPLALDRNKALALLVYVAVTRQAHTRQSLATLFWPEYDQSKALAYLRRALWTLNSALGEGWLHSDRETVALAPGVPLWLDLERFRQLIRSCERHGHSAGQVCRLCLTPLSEAAGLYQRDFLVGFSLRDSPAFDDWQFFLTEDLRAELASALQRLAHWHFEQLEFEPALRYGRRWLALDRLNEEAHRLLITTYALDGQRLAALRQYQECARLLEEELGVQPDPDTRLLVERLHSPDMRSTLSTTPQEKTPVPAPEPVGPALLVNLPDQATEFVGRQADLDEITSRLEDPACRLLTLLGPGGAGKTRLAVQAASLLAEQAERMFPGGICFASLASLRAAEQVVPAIGAAVKYAFRSEPQPGDENESQKVQLLDYLRPRQTLLLLDNFEHLLDAVGLVSDLLAEAPRLKLLVTSRQRLNLCHEWVFEVGGMQYPENGSAQSLESYSAVQLFLQTARRLQGGFTADGKQLTCIARICLLLEGMPLAIELAAAWVRWLSCDEIAQEIERSLDFLQGSWGGIPDRHQSLRAVFEHSWALLTAVEQRAFSRLSVFRSPFRRQAAEHLIDLGDPGSGPGYKELSLLSSLVDKSLLQHSPSGFYKMHELLKQYAAERLEQSDSGYEQARDHHAALYAGVLEQCMGDLTGPRQLEALARLDVELDDIRYAWSWMVERSDVPGLARSFLGLLLFYKMSGRIQEGQQDFELAVHRLRAMLAYAPEGELHRALSGDLALAQAILANFYNYAGDYEVYVHLQREALQLSVSLDLEKQADLLLLLDFCSWSHDKQQIYQYYKKSLDVFAQRGDQWKIAMAHYIYSYPVADGNLNAARPYLRRALGIFRALGDRWGISGALIALADNLYYSGEYQEAQRNLEASRALVSEMGDRWYAAWSLFKLGQVATALGDYEQARQYYHHNTQWYREVGNRRLITHSLACEGHASYLLQEYDRAEVYFTEVLEICEAIDYEHEKALAYSNLGNVSRGQGRLEKAKRYYQDAQAILDRVGESWASSLNLSRMAGLYTQLGELDQSWAFTHRALAVKGDQIMGQINILGDIAELLARQGQFIEAVELLAFVLAHPSALMETKETSFKLLSELEDQLPEGEFQAAQARGRELQLGELVLKYQ